MKVAGKLNVRDDQAYNVKLHVRHQYWKRRMEMRLMYWLCDELEAEVDIGHHDLALERDLPRFIVLHKKTRISKYKVSVILW